MTAVDLAGESKTPPPSLSRPGNPTPGGPYPSPQPSGPKPPPTPPPPRQWPDDLFDLAASLGEDVAFALPNTRVPLVFAEGEHRLVGGVWPPEGPFPGSPPSPPPDPGPPSAGGDDRPQPGQPGPPPDPRPYPPPVRALPPVPPWVAARRRGAELGHGPLYDVLPGGAR